jgi:hypothetical protein
MTSAPDHLVFPWGKKNQTLTLLELSATGLEGVEASKGRGSGYGNDPDTLEGNPRSKSVFHKVVRRRHGSDSPKPGQRKQVHQHPGVQMTIVIRGDDERSIRWEAFTMPDIHTYKHE